MLYHKLNLERSFILYQFAQFLLVAFMCNLKQPYYGHSWITIASCMPFYSNKQCKLDACILRAFLGSGQQLLVIRFLLLISLAGLNNMRKIVFQIFDNRILGRTRQLKLKQRKGMHKEFCIDAVSALLCKIQLILQRELLKIDITLFQCMCK